MKRRKGEREEGKTVQKNKGRNNCLFQRDVKKALQRNGVRANTFSMRRGSQMVKKREGISSKGNCVYKVKVV